MLKGIRPIVRRPFLSNLLSLYGVQVAKYLFPLVTIPYLTRVLGASGWGLLALTQGYGAYLALPVDYGFNFSGTREVARLRDDRARLSETFGAVTGAKCLLAAACVIISFGVGHWVPVFRQYPLLLWTGVFAALTPCFVPIWYFLGLERLKLVSGLDVFARALGTAGIFVIVRNPGDAWKALASWGVAGGAAAIVGTWLACRGLAVCLPSWGEVWQVLRDGRSMFVSRAAIGVYVSGNAFILGLFAPPLLVGYYAGAEKIIRAALQLFQSPYMVLFPKMSNLVHRDRARSIRLARISAVAFGGSGLVLALAIAGPAPWLVQLILGDSFPPAAPVLRILVVLLPLSVLATVQGGLWMVPHGLDRAFEAVAVGAAGVDVGLAVLLAPRYQALGMAWAVVLSELFVVLSMFSYLTLKRQGFWGAASRPAGESGKKKGRSSPPV